MGGVRAESALEISSFVRFNTYAKISQIRCTRDFASCHGPGYRTKKDIHLNLLKNRPSTKGVGLFIQDLKNDFI
jgi:hypothetical protein